ncbi:hypothetical protein Poly59_21840 [Rubripirellula reticaptiva]|uniref:Uncharacterized protein n=1 Tax=Rubripirellula reticaptiva TaxID=2528013 RepID=A0A5C6F8N6_9BACT|nr:hypothetical protein Poly59_21840 [Rubripirellula reticaptiva]
MTSDQNNSVPERCSTIVATFVVVIDGCCGGSSRSRMRAAAVVLNVSLARYCVSLVVKMNVETNIDVPIVYV